jgi:dTMP kinase
MTGVPGQGRLIAVEGISGVGKTYLTQQAVALLPGQQRPIVIEEFSRRLTDSGDDLGRALLRTLRTAAADGDPFLRGNVPATETLLLLAIKMHDYEEYCASALRQGRTVVEGRGVHTTAIYQSLILHPDNDEHAHSRAQDILVLAQTWRPLPDLTVLITDDVTTAVRRAEDRDGISYTPEQWRLHHRAANAYARLADDDPHHVHMIDRRGTCVDEVARELATCIAGTHSGLAGPATTSR